MSDAVRDLPLSCYTTNLVAALGRDDPTVPRRFAAAVRLAVREHDLAFSHHTRIDDGRLHYAHEPRWERAALGLAAELVATGAVLAVGNTAHLPWSPAYGRIETPHWILLSDRLADRWLVTDHFAALLPHGEQEPHQGWVSDDQLRALLTPVTDLPAHVAARDAFALGTETDAGPLGAYRWLARVPARPVPADTGEWHHGGAALRHLADRLTADPELIARHADDLWAAARHHEFAHPDVADAWRELPRALRFATESAARGRPRPALVRMAFDNILAATDASPTLVGTASQEES